jgi:hypothetical protein
MSVAVPGWLLMAGGLPMTHWVGTVAMSSGIIFMLLLVCVVLMAAVADPSRGSLHAGSAAIKLPSRASCGVAAPRVNSICLAHRK